MPTIVIPDDFPPVMATSAAYRQLAERATVRYHDTLAASEDDLIARIGDADVVINIRSFSRFTAEVFRRCPKLRLLSLWGTGTDHVDLPAARQAGVTVTNTPGVAAISIGEHCLALMLAVARQLPRGDAFTRTGEWRRLPMAQMHGKTLGIVGLGAIGRQFARLGQGIGMRVIAWTLHPNPALGFELVALDELLRVSDVVSIHLRLSPQTTGLIGMPQLALMKPTAILINTARGAIVDEAAMVEVLATRRIAGAGLDVFETEPLPGDHPLTRLENVALTPHAAGITPEAVEAGLQMAIQNVWDYFAGTPINLVAG